MSLIFFAPLSCILRWTSFVNALILKSSRPAIFCYCTGCLKKAGWLILHNIEGHFSLLLLKVSSSSSDTALVIMSKITMLATTGLTKKLLVMVMMVVVTSSSSPTPTHRLQIDHGIATTLRPAFSSFLCGRLPSPPSPPPAPPPSV